MPENKLREFLLTAFSSEELRRLLRWLGVSEARKIHDTFPSPSNIVRDVEHVVDGLTRMPDLVAPFFVALRAERPKRLAEIAAIEQGWAKPAGSALDRAFAAAMLGRQYGPEETATARAWFEAGWKAREA